MIIKHPIGCFFICPKRDDFKSFGIVKQDFKKEDLPMNKGKQAKLPLNIQFFAEDGGTTPAVATGTNATTQNTNTIDYDKIQGMIDSRNQRNEDSILKSYFQKQGLSEDEMNQAISTFKTQKEENSKKQAVDTQNLQNQLNESNLKYQKLQIESEAFKQAIDLQVDNKTIPYLIKLADFNGCIDDKGVIASDKVKEALNKVLTDVPSLKAKESDSTAGVQVGADTSNGSQPSGNMFGFNFTGVRKH